MTYTAMEWYRRANTAFFAAGGVDIVPEETLEDQLERFMAKVNKTETCWLWTASLNSEGYGQFHVTGRAAPDKAHRWAFQHFVGPIPEKHEIHHTCQNRICVNPAHLELTTKHDHSDAAPSINRNKTHCPQGHPYSDENLYVPPDGGRRCRICSYEKKRDWRLANGREHDNTK